MINIPRLVNTKIYLYIIHEYNIQILLIEEPFHLYFYKQFNSITLHSIKSNPRLINTKVQLFRPNYGLN